MLKGYGQTEKVMGRLYGVGVGPGDPDLITLRAVKVLNQVDVVFAAASSDNEYSIALNIARPHMKTHCKVERLAFPMTRDREVLEEAWRQNSAKVMDVLAQGMDVAFITLGDPLTYSTFGHLLREILAAAPGLEVTTIPGITSYHAACARLNLPVAEGPEGFQVISGINGQEDLEAALRRSDTVFILKAYRNFPSIKEAIKGLGLESNTILVKRLYLDGEGVVDGIDGISPSERMPYFTLLIVKKRVSMRGANIGAQRSEDSL